MSEPDPFLKFRQLLKDTYLFPANYTHKFIGKNTDLFRNSVAEFEGKFVGLKRVGEKQSANGNHLALTYDFLAGTAEDIIDLAKATYLVGDLLYIL
jgi:putative lipoic acid-binding regulatory protein